jgi:hypothetical protein
MAGENKNLPCQFFMSAFDGLMKDMMEKITESRTSKVEGEKEKIKPPLMDFEEFLFLMLGDASIDPSVINKGDSVYYYMLHLEKCAEEFSEKIKFNLRDRRFQSITGLINITKPLGLNFVEKRSNYDFICKDEMSFAFIRSSEFNGGPDNCNKIVANVGRALGMWALFSEYGKKNFLFSKQWVLNKDHFENFSQIEGAFYDTFNTHTASEDLNFSRIYNFMFYMSMCFFAYLVFPTRIFCKIYDDFDKYKGHEFKEEVKKKYSIPELWLPLITPRLKVQRILNKLDEHEKLNFLESL